MNLYAYVGNDPVDFVDPLGLWTVSIGVNIGAMFGAVGGGAVTGIGVGVGVTLAATNASSVEQLLGTTVEASRGLGSVAVTGIAGKGYTGGALTIGIGGETLLPSKGAGIVTNTSAIAQWKQNSGFSFLKADSGGK